MKKIAYVKLLIVFASGIGSSAAFACVSALQSLTLAQIAQYYPDCLPSNGNSSQGMTANSGQQVIAISSGVGSRLLGLGAPPGAAQSASIDQTGFAAGAPTDKWNAWVNASLNASRYDARMPTGRMVTGMDVRNVVVGADIGLGSGLVAGVSGAFDRGEGQAGVSPVDILNTKGYAVAPYIGWQISKALAVDASVGFGDGENSRSGGVLTDSRRQFVAANLTYSNWMGNWQLTGKAGILSAEEKFSDTRINGAATAVSGYKTKLDQGRVSAEAGYWLGNGMMPFFGVGYAADIRRVDPSQAPWDRDAFNLTAGLNFFSLKDKISGGVVYTGETGRSYTRNSTLMGNVNIRF